MHKNKRKKQQAKEKAIWKQVLEWGIIIAIGLIIGIVGANWLNQQSFMQPQYARPSDLSFQSGIPMLTAYCLCLVSLMVLGFFFARRIDSGLSKDTQVAHKYVKMAQDSRKTRLGR